MNAPAKNLERPQAKDWNNYWGLEQTQRFTRISWSKKRIIRILQPYISSGYKALDAGCGSGFFSKYFCDQKMHVTALDYSQAALDIAKSKTNGLAHLVKANLVDDKLCDLVPHKYDLIFTDGLLEHFSVTDQDRIIRNLSGVLTNNGVMVNFVPNKWSPWELIRPFYMPGIQEDPFVLRELTDLHNRNNLKVISSGGINTLPAAFSPDSLFGAAFGMLLYNISKKL